MVQPARRVNQGRGVEHQPADSYQLPGGKSKAVDISDSFVQIGNNANKVEIHAFTICIPNIL